MKNGEVVHIRVNAEDIMGCIDVLDKAKCIIPGMSIAQVVRLSLSGLLQSARDAHMIPERDGYEYGEMMSRFTPGRTGKKLSISSTIQLAEIRNMNEDKPSTVVHIPPPATYDIVEDSPQVKRRKGQLLTEIMELNTKFEHNVENFTKTDATRLTQLNDEYNSFFEQASV